MPSFRPAIGTSDFLAFRELGATYVDKTRHIGPLFEDLSEVLLFPRPRRFGKTLFLSMLRYWLERPPPGQDRSWMFQDLDAWNDPRARAHFGRYPVLYLTFKDLKPGSWAECLQALGLLLQDLTRQLRPQLDPSRLPPELLAQVTALAERRADASTLAQALRLLSEALHTSAGERVVLLIDEYDTPLQAAWLGGFWDEAVVFFRGLLGAGLKDNPHLRKGVLTGILRVARESIFSGLNNLVVYSVLRARYSALFGFTEAEVQGLVALAGAEGRADELRRWYNGYRFGDELIYNPWSVLNYLNNPDEGPRAWWANTSGNELVQQLLLQGDRDRSQDLERLMQGEVIEKEVDETVVFSELDTHPDAVWSLLLMTGYLKALAVSAGRRPSAQLAIPNEEVLGVYEGTFSRWLSGALGGDSAVRALANAVLHGDEDEFGSLLQHLLTQVMSFHDLGPRTPESVYHAFVLGLLTTLMHTHELRSNREAGFGRADALLIPRKPGQPGCVLELKRTRPGQTAQQALEQGLAQLKERDYAAELRARGAEPVVIWAIAFAGKEVVVRKG